MDSKPEEVYEMIPEPIHVDCCCWVRKGSPIDIYCRNYEHILNAIKADGAVSRNEVERISSTFSSVQSTVNTQLFQDLSQFSPTMDRRMDPKHIKTEMCSVWEKENEAEMFCTFLVKPDETCTLVKRDPVHICTADQVMELLAKCSDATKTTKCIMPENVTGELDYINVVSAVMGINLIKPGRPLYERVLFFPLSLDNQQTGHTLIMGDLLLPKIKSGSLRLVNMGLLHDIFLHQFMGIYTSDFLTHLGALMEQHKKMTQVQTEQPCIKFY